MAGSSGSLGGDDSSKLDALAKSIAENSEKLEILNKILGKIEDASDIGGKKETSTTDVLKNVEKLVSKADIEKARSASKSMQVDADRLAANTFRASETVISEVLSRLGGTSFYPVLSAFRVARESVSTATGTPQSELKVSDMIKFVNQSTTELLTNIFTKFEFGVNSIEEPVIDLNKALEQTKQDLIDIREALMPVTTDIKKELAEIMKLDPSSDEFQNLTLEEMKKYAEYILALNQAGDATSEHIMLLNQLDLAYQVTGESIRNVIDAEKQKKLLENIEKEKSSLAKEGPQLQQKLYEERKSQSEIQKEAMESARTVAGIAGALIPIGFSLNSAKNIYNSLQDLTSKLADATIGNIANASGGDPLKSATGVVGSATNIAGDVAGLAGGIAASLIPGLGVIAAPIGSFLGKAITETLLAPINITAQTLVSINDSVKQIADDLVGFSPEVTGAVIGKEIAILKDDFRRAAQVGPQIARITEAQTRLQLATRQSFDNLLVTTEPILVNILDTLTNIFDTLPTVVSMLAAIPGGFIPGFDRVVAKLMNLNLSVDEIAKKLGTNDPIELESLAYQSGTKFFSNNPSAAVRLK